MKTIFSLKGLASGHILSHVDLALDFKNNFDLLASETFNLQGHFHVRLHGTGRHRVQKLIKYDLGVITEFATDVVLEIGTNDLTVGAPEIVGSDIDDFVRLLHCSFAKKIIGVYVPRGNTYPQASDFDKAVMIF